MRKSTKLFLEVVVETAQWMLSIHWRNTVFQLEDSYSTKISTG